jgi:hypothetical protein
LWPRIFFGTGRNVFFLFESFQIVVFHVLPSTFAMTGVMPQEPVTGGEMLFGRATKVQAPLPSVVKSVPVKW